MTNGKEAHWANVTAWEPPNRLVLAWQVNPDTPGPTEIEMRFEPEGAVTRFHFEHRGWESVPQEHVARHGFPEGIFLQRHGEWWQHLLRSYRGRLDETAARES